MSCVIFGDVTDGGQGGNPLFVANVTSYLVIFIRILQNLYFIYPI